MTKRRYLLLSFSSLHVIPEDFMNLSAILFCHLHAFGDTDARGTLIFFNVLAAVFCFTLGLQAKAA